MVKRTDSSLLLLNKVERIKTDELTGYFLKLIIHLLELGSNFGILLLTLEKGI